ncbi:hypothetical protein K1W54_04965 [Micromonospora sp. CPCC 205371]|nr:hypothetical protein [Micromonospora sp. CPCC 205371]
MTNPKTPLDLDAIRARADAATEGPWVSGADYQPSWLPHELITAPENPIVEFTADEQGAADADFAAHAREDVPALLAAIDRVMAVEASRLGADERVRELCADGDRPEVAFYAGASFALAKVRRALVGGAS